MFYFVFFLLFSGFLGGFDGKDSCLQYWRLGLIPGLGRSPGRGSGNPLQYSGLFFFPLLSFLKIEVLLTYNRVLLSGIVHRDSVIFEVYNPL